MMTGCRISEEDRGDPYFDGMTETEEAIEAEIEAEEAESRREQFKELLGELVRDTSAMLTRPHWSPDEDDIDMLLAIQEELYWYNTVAKNKEAKK